MELKKANDTYDVYNAKLSYLELTALADALRAGGEGPIADELRRSFEWHIDRVPGPGQDKKEKEMDDEAAPVAGPKPEPEKELSPDVKKEVDDLLPEPPTTDDVGA